MLTPSDLSNLRDKASQIVDIPSSIGEKITDTAGSVKDWIDEKRGGKTEAESEFWIDEFGREHRYDRDLLKELNTEVYWHKRKTMDLH